jgi:hypothetical protein
MSNVTSAVIGFDTEEIDTSMSTRAARLKWVIVVNDSIPPGRAVNAAICAAGATVAGVPGLLGPGGIDGSGSWHPGLPWVGCSILVADSAVLRSIRTKGAAHVGTFVADMPNAAQETRVYDDYITALGAGDPAGIEYLAVSLVGPKNRIDKIVGRLPLMS